MALGELLAVRAVQQRQVGVARRLVAERGEDEQLLGRIGEVVVAAHDLGDPHLGIVDRDSEVVEDRFVAAGDDEIVVAAVGKADRTANQVVDHGLALIGHPQPHRATAIARGLAAVSTVGTVLGLPRLDVLCRGRVAVGRAGIEQLAAAPPRGARLARLARSAPRPSRARATPSRRGSGPRSPRSSARGRCPRSAAPAHRHHGGRQASCRERSGRRQCAGHRLARGRSGAGSGCLQARGESR